MAETTASQRDDCMHRRQSIFAEFIIFTYLYINTGESDNPANPPPWTEPDEYRRYSRGFKTIQQTKREVGIRRKSTDIPRENDMLAIYAVLGATQRSPLWEC
jgi:hypothetical protein